MTRRPPSRFFCGLRRWQRAECHWRKVAIDFFLFLLNFRCFRVLSVSCICWQCCHSRKLERELLKNSKHLSETVEIQINKTRNLIEASDDAISCRKHRNNLLMLYGKPVQHADKLGADLGTGESERHFLAFPLLLGCLSDFSVSPQFRSHFMYLFSQLCKSSSKK